MSKTKKEMSQAALVILQRLKKMKIEEVSDAEKIEDRIGKLACELGALIKVYVKQKTLGDSLLAIGDYHASIFSWPFHIRFRLLLSR